MAVAQDRFAELETRIARTVELVKTLRAEVARLERENQELRHERDVVKNKIESMLDTLSELTEESLV
ncbi:MAG: cell division protein ZapB [Acidobacteria bacterium]|nr:cell division protein ZapB [Acidobacteriota bacterium]